MEGVPAMEQTQEPGELVERVAALDIGKASVMARIRIPDEDQRRRRQEVCEYGTTTGALLTLAGHLQRKGVTLVVMEAPTTGSRCSTCQGDPGSRQAGHVQAVTGVVVEIVEVHEGRFGQVGAR